MKNISNQVEFVEERPDHHYRTEIPNILIDILDPIALAVYCHLKYLCQNSNECEISIKILSKLIGIGQTKLKETLNKLSSINYGIILPLIEIIRRKKSDGSKDSNLIKIIDVWHLSTLIERGSNG